MSGFAELVRAIVQAQDEVRAASPRGRARVRAALLEGASRRARWPLFAASACAIAMAVIAILLLRPAAALTFDYGPEREPGIVGAWLAAPAERDETLRFSDGSEIDLHPHTRARVALLDADDASFVLESGSAEARIESGASRRWHVHAGPYRVEVTGTRFSFAWDPDTEAFALALHEGTVIVDGPGIDAPRRVTAGETMHVGGREYALASKNEDAPTNDDPPRKEHAVTNEGAPESGEEANVADPPRPQDVGEEEGEERQRRSTKQKGAAPGATDCEVGAPATGSRPAGRACEPDGAGGGRRPPQVTTSVDDDAAGVAVDTWNVLAKQARYREALAAAEDYGLAALCESLPARDLLQLADVARFARKPARAIEVLRAVRRRFPDTDAAAMAAFERGRIAKAASSAYPEAAKWFATYLREARTGPLAREALARLMEVQAEAGEHAAARDTATSYLERFPKGPDADVARRLAASSP